MDLEMPAYSAAASGRALATLIHRTMSSRVSGVSFVGRPGVMKESMGWGRGAWGAPFPS